MAHTRCLEDDELVALAFDAGTPGSAALERVAVCDHCAARLVRLLQAARGVSVTGAASVPVDACLTDGQLAELAQGGDLPDPHALTHLAACARCSRTLSSLVPLLGDAEVRAELRKVEPARLAARRRTFLGSAVGAATVAAALVAGLIFRPDATPVTRVPEAAPHRQSASATDIAPRIVTPVPPRTVPDTLRWTSVPFADRYQVLMFDREGSLAWEAQTPDTAVALPERLRTNPAAYLWKVEARTDWNRWVASEWAELAIPSRP